MDERRKAKRIELSAKLYLERVDVSENPSQVDIEVYDISTSGIGFKCVETLSIGGVYDADLTLWTKDVIHTFIQIVRISKFGDSYQYGGVFIGMPEIDSKRIQIYDTVNTYSKE